MSPEITDISKLVSFPQPGLNYHIGDDAADHDSVVVFQSGQTVTIMWSFLIDLAPDMTPLEFIEMVLPPGFEGLGAAGAYSYTVDATVQQPSSVYIEPEKTGANRLAFYPYDWGSFPVGKTMFITGQMTYTAAD